VSGLLVKAVEGRGGADCWMRGGCGHKRDAEMGGTARSGEKYLSYFLFWKCQCGGEL